MKGNQPPVFILLLNYRGAEDTMACLDSLRWLVYKNFRIVVIDNASPDDSVAQLQARLAANPDEFHFIQSPKNLGFSGGNNLGIQYALNLAGLSGEAYVWLLNNDTTVAPDSLSHLVQTAQGYHGLIGSKLVYPDGSYQQVGTRIHWWTGSTKGYDATELEDGMRVDSLSGASMLIPMKAIREVGPMDESFFLYFEDGEYSLRCARQAYSLRVALKSKVFHKEGATTGRKSPNTQYYYHRNRLRMLKMYANPAQWLCIRTYTAFRMLRAEVKSLLGSSPEQKQSLKIQKIALQDFARGVKGPCPHNLERL